MKQQLLTLMCTFLMIGLSTQATAQELPERRSVTISATVLAATGGAVAGVVVIVELSPNSLFAAVTNEMGVATVSIEAPVGESVAYASLADESDKLDGLDRVASREAYRSAIEESHFKASYTVAIGAEVSSVPVVIQGEQCVSVSLHALTSSFRRRFAVGCYPALPQPTTSRAAPDVTVRGIKKGSPAMLVVSNPNRPGVKIIELDATETSANRVINDVEVPADDGTEAVTIRVNDRTDLVQRPHVPAPVVTLLSSDLSRCYCGFVQVEGNGRVVNMTLAPLRLHPGTYAVVPGLIGYDRGPGAVYGQIKSTGQVPAGIPAIEIVEGGQNAFEVDLVPARSTSLSLPPYP